MVKFSSIYMDKITGFSPEEYLNNPFLNFVAPAVQGIGNREIQKKDWPDKKSLNGMKLRY